MRIINGGLRYVKAIIHFAFLKFYYLYNVEKIKPSLLSILARYFLKVCLFLKLIRMQLSATNRMTPTSNIVFLHASQEEVSPTAFIFINRLLLQVDLNGFYNLSFFKIRFN